MTDWARMTPPIAISQVETERERVNALQAQIPVRREQRDQAAARVTQVERQDRKRVARSHTGGSGRTSPGTAASCHPNYTGACLPLVGDVACGEISARNFGSVGSDPSVLMQITMGSPANPEAGRLTLRPAGRPDRAFPRVTRIETAPWGGRS